MLRAAQNLPKSIRLGATVAAVALAYLFQLPIERDIPGEPFLPFLLVVIASTLAFGVRAGLIAVALSTILSVPFFEPVGSFAIQHATDLIKIELYAVLASCCVIGFARLRNMLIAAGENADELRRLNERKSVLLRELSHGVANNFASIAAFISLRSTSVKDTQSKAILNEAIEQVRMMGLVHRRLRADDRDVSLGSQAFFENLCDALKASMGRGRKVSIKCEADDLPLSQDQAVSLGLIVNELVTNAIKHAFPEDRRGCIRVGFSVFEDGHLHLRVEDDGVGFARSPKGEGLGQELVKALSRELGAQLELKTSETGSLFQLCMPGATSAPFTGTHAPSTHIH